MLATLAEYERELIVERINAGIAASKQNGTRFGRARRKPQSHCGQTGHRRQRATGTDTPPQRVLLNSCNSASQIDALVKVVTPFAIGMADSIDDADVINYAARFYASIANGQSTNAAHLAGRSALELAGLDGATLPTLAVTDGADASAAVLVQPPSEPH